MAKILKLYRAVLLLMLALVLVGVAPVRADDGLNGWEKGGAYDRLYQVSELDRLKGDIKKIIRLEPLPGMAPGMGLILKDGDGEQVTVHIGPVAFLGKNIGLKRGDRVKIRGAWAEINGEDVFLAAKIKKGDYFSLKVRLTKNGTPFWAMTPEELAHERGQAQKK
ncbi:hypothetical protein [Desulfogranum mediterraneum]|uniref:hypothetical protein n=1 Tax=Desulfogranum mediterraneum TaxID=160661 RepID=UPI00040D4362|nr:hypothetical protein [Desulfogranum mediterraneum]